LFVILFVFINSIYSKKISNIDFDDIKDKTTDSTSKFYYPTLLKRFSGGDTLMTKEEFKMIYYGNVFTNEYNPLGNSKDEDNFK